MKSSLLKLSLILILAACATEREDKPEVLPQVEYPDQESWDATIYITRQGKVAGFLKAGHIEKYSQKNITLLKDSLKVDFYNEQGQHTSILTSEGGKVFDLSNDMIAFGNVVVISDSGLTLFTDTLKWDNERQKIISEIPIKITTEEGDTLFGDSFISDANLKNREIVNPRGKSSKSIKID